VPRPGVLLEQMIYTKEARDERTDPAAGGCQPAPRQGIGKNGEFFENPRNGADDIRTLLVKGTTTTELRNEATKGGYGASVERRILKVKSNNPAPSSFT